MAVAGVTIASLTLMACGDTQETTTPDQTTTQVEPTEEATSVEEATETPTEAASPQEEATVWSDLSGLEVDDADLPAVDVPAPWAIDSTQVEVIRDSDNPQVLNDNSVATVHYIGVNGRTGEVFNDSYELGQPVPFSLQQVIPGFVKGLSGQKVGSRVLIGMPPEDGYPQGQPPHIEPGDSLIFVVDIISANFDEATGEAVEPAEGLPAVTMETDGPTVAMPDAEPPAELVIQPLVQGPGQQVQESDVIQVKFRTWNWTTGEMIEDAWHPQQGPLGSLIEGWKQGLVGQTTGSRMLLVAPPEMAYPNGNPSNPTVEPGQTLVYVIDILYTSESPQ